MSSQARRAQYLIKEGCWRHEISQGMAPKAGGGTTGLSAAAAQLRQQPDDLQVKPDQRDQQAKGRVPFHELRKAVPRSLLDEIKIQHQIQRRNHHDKQADADAEGAAVMEERHLDAEKPKDEARSEE